jgi:hypothetical protein
MGTAVRSASSRVKASDHAGSEVDVNVPGIGAAIARDGKIAVGDKHLGLVPGTSEGGETLGVDQGGFQHASPFARSSCGLANSEPEDGRVFRRLRHSRRGFHDRQAGRGEGQYLDSPCFWQRGQKFRHSSFFEPIRNISQARIIDQEGSIWGQAWRD